MQPVRFYFFLTSFSILFAGCAQRQQTPPPAPPPQHPAQSGPEKLSIVSTPSGASVKLSTGERCTTPCSIVKSAKEPFSVTVEMEHYITQTVQVTNNLKALQKYNRTRGASEQALQELEVQSLKLVPNPVSVSLEPFWTK